MIPHLPHSIREFEDIFNVDVGVRSCGLSPKLVPELGDRFPNPEPASRLHRLNRFAFVDGKPAHLQGTALVLSPWVAERPRAFGLSVES